MLFMTNPRVVTVRSASNPTSPNSEISGSAVTANALILLQRAAETGGLKLTATGNLSRAVVAEMCGTMEWPAYNKDELVRYYTVINEPDFLPLHFVRILAKAAKLLRTHRGRLVPTRLSKRMLALERHGPLQAVLFHVAFWHLNLAYFDRYALNSWPLQLKWASSCGRFRRRHTIGCRERHSRGFARLPSSTFWSGNGISAPVPWRPAFSDHCSGSGS